MICFQEVLPHVAVWLKQELSEYYVIGCGRSATLEDEQAAIAYRKDRINLIQMETYWLSDTPYNPASRYQDQSICPRIATEAVFEEYAAKTVFRVVNTHLDHEGVSAREKGLRQIMDKVERAALFAKAPVIVAGDMNAEPDSPEMAVAKEYSYGNAAEGVGITYHGYGRSETPCCIDYIFTRGFTCERMEKWTDERDGLFLSDHYPLCAVLHAEETCAGGKN